MVVEQSRDKVLFTTQRGLRHQQSAIDSVPPQVEIIMRRDPSRAEMLNLLPDFPETRRMLNAEFFSACKRGVLLVHAGGGTTYDVEAVAAALRSGQLSGAALDTFNWEPIRADDPLVLLAKACPEARGNPQANLLITPHTAAGAQAAIGAEFKRNKDYDNLLAALDGQPLAYRVC